LAEPDAEAHPNRIEMTIDSLASHMLTEPMPITIDPLGEAAYTAAVRAATGNSITEALVLLRCSDAASTLVSAKSSSRFALGVAIEAHPPARQPLWFRFGFYAD
jgi:hypothetical protein